MELQALLDGVRVLGSDAAPGLAITSLAYDSRRCKAGTLFFALPGFKADGHDFVGRAREAGAVAAVVERLLPDGGLAQVQVAGTRQAMALAAANFNGHPSHRLALTGVTGTNGKTTTTFMLDSILRAGGHRTGLLGGIEYRVGGRVLPAVRTTPESIDLQAMLAEMADAGATDATIEVSSHGIDLFRAGGLSFRVAVFTNLTQDHLDLHGSLEEYFLTKRRLFMGGVSYRDESAWPGPEQWPGATINIDDAYGARLAGELAGRGGAVIGFGLGAGAAVTASNARTVADSQSFILKTPEGAAAVDLRLPGEHNLYNALAAAGAAVQLGIDTDTIASGLSAAAAPPGRFQELDVDAPFRVIVDYAHNEDGLSKTLEAARALAAGRLITVFGCPGERDRDKRPRMGEVAGRLSDIAILTTDDCYGEPPEQIMDAAETGLKAAGADYRREADRRAAIQMALATAVGGDIVLIAGKGHETRQIMAGGAEPFSDQEVVREILSERRE